MQTLSGAMFAPGSVGADLSRANLTGANLSGALMPDGLIHHRYFIHFTAMHKHLFGKDKLSDVERTRGHGGYVPVLLGDSYKA